MLAKAKGFLSFLEKSIPYSILPPRGYFEISPKVRTFTGQKLKLKDFFLVYARSCTGSKGVS